MAAKRSVGRPKRRQGRERKVILTVRIRADERDRIEAAADRVGKTLSAWSRDRLLEALARRRS